jgi:hypothetical protein
MLGSLEARIEDRERLPAQEKTKVMLTLVKIAIAVAIGFAVVNPSFTPKADDASCRCSADA